MKIAYFTDTYYPQLNGVATYVGYVVKKIYQKNYQVHLFAPKIKAYQDKEDYVHRLPSIRALPNLPDSIRLPLPIPHKSIWKIIKFDFDIVHAHGNAVFSLIGLAVARAKKVPYILTFHTQIGQFTHYFLKGKVVKANLLNNILLKRFGNLCDGVITPSEKMKDELIAAGVTKHIEVIPNFIDYEKFHVKTKGYLHKKYKIPESNPILLSVGRLGKEKNFEFLIRVLQKLTKINQDAHLVIAGEGFEKKNLTQLIFKLGLKKRAHLIGGVPIDDMPYVYADSDIFVFPSTSEVHPMVALEAAAASLPLIVAKDGAYKNIVINNKNGYLCPLDQDVFVEKISLVLKNPKLRQKFSKASAQIVKKNFNPDLLTQKLLNYYQKTIRNYQLSKNSERSSKRKVAGLLLKKALGII